MQAAGGIFIKARILLEIDFFYCSGHALVPKEKSPLDAGFSLCGFSYSATEPQRPARISDNRYSAICKPRSMVFASVPSM